MSGQLKTMDGNMAAAYVSYAFTETSAIYPITPSSPMADYTSIWALNKKKNIFGQPVKLIQMQSEAGAAGALHGMLNSGTLAATYTSSQGLLLMIPDMYKIAGELLPAVINVAARTIATHALSIFGDHQDVYACRQTGFAMLASGNVQEIMHLGAVAHLAAIEGRVPFMHFFDGFRTSHEIQKIHVWDYDTLKGYCDMEAVRAFKKRSLNPERPVIRGSAQNPDVFFQIRESSNIYYNMLPAIVEKYMNMVNADCNTGYKLFNYYGDESAESVIIAMGSVCDTIEETIDILQGLKSNSKQLKYKALKGDVKEKYKLSDATYNNTENCKEYSKVGLIRVHLYRPFSREHLIKAIPPTVKVINVLDRTKEPGAVSEPLYEDVVTALKGSAYENTKVLGGRYGLSSKNTTPVDIMAVFNNDSKDNYTVGINDDVTHTSLDSSQYRYCMKKDYYRNEENNKKDRGKFKSDNNVLQENTEKSISDNNILKQENIEKSISDNNILKQENIEKSISDNNILKIEKENFKKIYSCKFWGIGADGTVGASKNVIKIIGDNTDMQVQAYFEYDSKKSGGLTISHIRFGSQRIKSAYLIENADFAACNDYSFLRKYDLIHSINKNGTLLVNCALDDETFCRGLSVKDRKYIRDNNIKVFAIAASKIAKDTGLGIRIGTIMQAAFFRIIDIMDMESVTRYMKHYVNKTYSSKGEAVVNMNCDAIDMAVNSVREIHISDADLMDNVTSYDTLPDRDITGSINTDEISQHENEDSDSCKNTDYRAGDASEISHEAYMAVDFVKDIQVPISRCKGDELPVSAFLNMADGTLPVGTSAYEKRGISRIVPLWNPDGCIQCNRCSFVCPHGVIRPVALTDEQRKKAPDDMKMAVMAGEKEKYFAIIISTDDCTGCTLCSDICPGNIKNNVLKMNGIDKAGYQKKCYEYAMENNDNKNMHDHFERGTVKGSQFFLPLLEFSGACAGCGETAYAKLATQLFGERMIIANATGCSSIWAASMPSSAYTVNQDKKGPAWSNSLFEDAAEYGYGIHLASEYNRNVIWEKLMWIRDNSRKNNIGEVKCSVDNIINELGALINSYEKYYNDGGINCVISDKIIAKLEEYKDINNDENVFDICVKNENQMEGIIDEILDGKEFLSKKSCWVFGGDGWAYDIGYGGLDHVASTGADINILIFDTEVYSNTVGQVSKATSMGAAAQFAADGKSRSKKNLAQMLMSYKDVYVAQVSLGADMNQCIKAFNEAEKYNGTSVIIAYAPCINHGIHGGMAKCTDEQKKAVRSGYWSLFRYNPDRIMSGKNAFILDSNEPDLEYTEFLMGENRFAGLAERDKARAELLFEMAKKEAMERYEYYKRLV